MACFILAHFVHGVVDGIIAQLLSPLSQHQLAFSGSGFRFYTRLEIGLGIRRDYLTQQLREFRRVLRSNAMRL